MQRQTQFRSICAYEHLVGSIIHTSWIGDYKHLYSTSIRNHLHSHALCQGLWLERVRETGRKYVMYSPNFLVSNPNHSTHPPLVHHVSHFELLKWIRSITVHWPRFTNCVWMCGCSYKNIVFWWTFVANCFTHLIASLAYVFGHLFEKWYSVSSHVVNGKKMSHLFCVCVYPDFYTVALGT